MPNRQSSRQSVRTAQLFSTVVLILVLAPYLPAAHSDNHNPSFCTILHEPIALPSVPKYTGRATFVGGSEYPASGKIGRRVLIKYGVREDCQTVISWYKEAMTEYSWKVAPTMLDITEIDCQREKNHCHIAVAAYPGPGWRSIVSISYEFGK